MIKDFKDGDKLTAQLLVVGVTKGSSNSGAPYLNLSLQDKSGSIDGKLWNVSDEDLAKIIVGRVYNFTFDVINYRNNLQAKVLKTETIDQSVINLTDFVAASPIKTEDLKNEIYGYLKTIKNENILKVLRLIMTEYETKFFSYPAATKNHHNFMGGLATHTLGMLKLADFICDQYPILSRDIMIAGVLLHDIGKTDELSGAILTEYTPEGKLLGHISMMQAKLYEVACKLQLENTEEITLLRHIILSHHGKMEYGSPVLPLIAEAEAITFIDNLDARMNTLTMAFSNTEPNSFTTRLFPMENRAFYKHDK